MKIQNTKCFQKFITEHEIIAEQEKDIERLIVAFSEYIVAVNPDYIYNKTYLKTYVDGFLLCQKFLKMKYQILKNEIIPRLLELRVEKECKVCIDGAWIYEDGRIKLNNLFNPYIIKRNMIQMELKFVHEKGFIIAEEIDIHRDYQHILEECILRFIQLRERVLGEEIEA